MVKKEKMEKFVIGETVYKTQLTEKFRNRKVWEQPDERLVKAYIPGNILEIFVKKGQKVKEGEKLMILEAMKMRNILSSPISGKIKAIHVETGVMVPKNKLLIELE